MKLFYYNHVYLRFDNQLPQLKETTPSKLHGIKKISHNQTTGSHKNISNDLASQGRLIGELLSWTTW